MNAISTHDAPCCCTFRWAGRIGTVLLIAGWLIAFLFEPNDLATVFPAAIYLQFAMLMVLFTGYTIGWFSEFVGGIVSLAGFSGYSIAIWIAPLSVSFPEDIVLFASLLVFAAPGILFLISWKLARDESPDYGSDRRRSGAPLAT